MYIQTFIIGVAITITKEENMAGKKGGTLDADTTTIEAPRKKRGRPPKKASATKTRTRVSSGTQAVRKRSTSSKRAKAKPGRRATSTRPRTVESAPVVIQLDENFELTGYDWFVLAVFAGSFFMLGVLLGWMVL